MPAITSANVAQAIVKLVAAEALEQVVGNLVMGRLVNRTFEPLLQSSGDVVNVPLPATLVANNLSEGGSVATQNPSLGNAQIVLNSHVEASFQVPDVTQAISNIDLLQTYMRSAVIALAEKIEEDIMALVPSFSANTPVGTANTPLTEAVIESALRTMSDAKIPMTNRALVVGPKGASEMRQIQRFTENDKAGNGAEAIINARLGRIKGFDVYESQYVAKVSTTTYNFAFHPDAIGMAIRRLPQPLPGTGAIAEYAEMGNFGLRVVMSYAPNTLAQQFTVDVLYGVAVLRNTFGVQVLN